LIETRLKPQSAFQDTLRGLNLKYRISYDGKTPGSAMRNTSVTGRSDAVGGRSSGDGDFMPEEGFDGTVTIIDGDFYNKSFVTKTSILRPRNTVVFHELYENFLRTAKKYDYPGKNGAHEKSSRAGNKFSIEVNNKKDKIHAGAASDFKPAEKTVEEPTKK